MRSKVSIALAVLGLAVLLAMVLAGRPSSSPIVYQGKSVQAWALQLDAPVKTDREQAQSVFKTLGSNSVPELTQLLKTHESILRSWAWKLFPKLPPRFQQAFLKRVKPPGARQIHRDAAQALSFIGPRAQPAIPALAIALQTDDSILRWDAANALASIGKPAVSTLTAALSSTNPSLRSVAASALGNIGPEALAATPELLRATGDKLDYVRKAAGYGLSKLGPEAAAILTNAMSQPDAQTRRLAIKALPLVHAPRRIATPALLAVARDPDLACREAALAVLNAPGIRDRPSIQTNLVAQFIAQAGLTTNQTTKERPPETSSDY